ncbi:MAG: tRNA (N6-threonylcarbamoyladenosine(37)-N6)-methyltransferase TrmO [Clostridia bacterium]|nr:tRNA (N6-threonylcarbamoyladenosine(37)-N6)-methyltransferase TrmO [Clostridia bacterium]
MEIKPIATIYTAFKEKFGIPRQSLRGKNLFGRIVFEKEFRSKESLRGIEDFSHLWLIFDFSKNHREGFSPTVRPPRLGGNARVGVFASRSPFRPNNLGLSSVRLIKTEDTVDGTVLIVEGVDILDGTPIYDIKPYLPSDCHPDAKGSYAENTHKLTVKIKTELENLLDSQTKTAIISCIEDDPRPSYQDDCTRVYTMRFADNDVSFTVDGIVATVIDIKKIV